jgi:hypothetical protein
MVIPKSLFQAVRQRAQFRCEYCHYPELLEPFIQNARRQWLAAGLHPSIDDPQESS